MVPKINGATPILRNVVRNTTIAGTLAVLSTHQVWPHPEKPSQLPRIEVTPEVSDVPQVDLDTDFDPAEFTPFGDIVANDNIIDVCSHIGDKIRDTVDNVRDFFESLGH